jgi:hypothetical protein
LQVPACLRFITQSFDLMNAGDVADRAKLCKWLVVLVAFVGPPLVIGKAVGGMAACRPACI